MHDFRGPRYKEGISLIRVLLTVASITLIAFTAGADNPKPPQNKESPKAENHPTPLKVGDLAPVLEASKWLQGERIRKFEPGKVYVIEFWAAWCGPCIIMMPHTAELQGQYKDKGVKCIAFTARDLLGVPGNTEATVAAFVKKRGPRLKLTFAYADDSVTADSWMKAAGREGIPCAFVVDKAGRIAYIGHPMYLGVVLPMVVSGNKTAQEVGKEATKIEQEFGAVIEAMYPDHKRGLKALKEFEAKYPPLANNPAILRAKLSHLPEIGEIGEAKKVAEAIVAKAIKQENPSTLLQVAALLRNGPGKESKDLLAVAVKAAEAAVRVDGGQDAVALLNLAETYFVVGDRAKARECARRAVEAAAEESAALREQIERQARKIVGEKSEYKN